MKQIREFVGQLFGGLGMLFLTIAVHATVNADWSKPDLKGILAPLFLGVLLIVAAVVLSPRSGRPRPRYWSTAVAGVVTSGCILTLGACLAGVCFYPKHGAPEWLKYAFLFSA